MADPKSRESLLRAAEEVFSERGVAGAKVEEIARRAGLSKGAFYIHFESKEAVLKHIVETWLARCSSLFAGPTDYPEVPDESASLLDFIIERDVAIYDFLWQSRATMRILQSCQGEYAYLIESFTTDMQRRNREWIHQFRRDGHVRPEVDPEIAAILMSGAHEELARRMIMMPQRPPIEAWVAFAQDTFVRAYGTPELIAVLEQRIRRVATGVHDRRGLLLLDLAGNPDR